MCGIVYVLRKDGKPAYKTVLKRYRNQRQRGTEGFGYVAIKNNEIVGFHRSTTEHEIIKKLEKEDAPEILFHHRNPTSTPNVTESAHPLIVENEKVLDYSYLFVHNGVVNFTDEAKKEHDKLGFKYQTEMFEHYFVPSSKKVYEIEGRKSRYNDSETLSIETALAIDGYKKAINIKGFAAVIGLQTTGNRVINRFFYRNKNPLNYHEDKQMILLSSAGEGQEVERWEIFRLKEGGGFEKFTKVEPPLSFTGESRYEKKEEYGGRQVTIMPERRSDSPFVGGERSPYDPRSERNVYDGMGYEDIPFDDFPSELDVAKHILQESLTYSYSALNKGWLNRLRKDVLTMRWGKCVEYEYDINKCAERIDESIASHKNYDPEMVIMWERLDKQAQEIIKYRIEIEGELTRRSAFAKT